MVSKEINSLDDLMGGALSERFEDAIKEIAGNISDPNTDAKKTRKITLTAVFKPNENRDMVQMEVDVKTTLAPPSVVTTSVMVGVDRATGQVTLAEVTKQIPGQMFTDGTVETQKVVKIGGNKND